MAQSASSPPPDELHLHSAEAELQDAVEQRPAVKPARTVPSLSVEGKVFLVTGGAMGIGEACARQLAAHGAKGLVLFDRNALGAQVVVCEGRNPACELDWVAARLDELHRSGVPLNEMAVLYRTHAVGRQVHAALKERRVPIGSSSAGVFARSDVAPLLALLRLLSQPDDDASFGERYEWTELVVHLIPVAPGWTLESAAHVIEVKEHYRLTSRRREGPDEDPANPEWVVTRVERVPRSDHPSDPDAVRWAYQPPPGFTDAARAGGR